MQDTEKRSEYLNTQPNTSGKKMSMSLLFTETAEKLSSRLGVHWERSDKDTESVFRNALNPALQEFHLYQEFDYGVSIPKVHCISITGGADFVLMGKPGELVLSINCPGMDGPSMWENCACVETAVDTFVTMLSKDGFIGDCDPIKRTATHKRKRCDRESVLL